MSPASTLIPAERAALIPQVGKPKPVKLPSVADEKFKNGLRVLAARRPGVPRVEARLVIPTARGDAGPAAQLRMVSRTLLSGTKTRSAVQIAELLQQIGGTLDASADEESVILTGSTLAADLPVLLDLMADVITTATFPDEEVALERARLVQEIGLARSQPETVAREALLRRLFGRHPYGRGLPDPREVEKVKAAQLAETTAERVLPTGSVLVLVGDVRPDRAAAVAGEAFAAWKSPRGAAGAGLPAPPKAKVGAITLVDRPGAVQTNVRMGGPAVNRRDPSHPALALASLVFGGYFVSRLVDNIREEKGYTYSPGSALQHLRQASYFFVTADVGTEVTGPALVEIRYELERMMAGPIEAGELQSAKRYLAGTLAMGIQTQAGLASYLATLATSDLPVEYLRDFPKRVEDLDADAVIDASREYLAPHRLVTVLVGNREAVAPVASAFGPLE